MNSVFFDMVGCRLNKAEIESLARDFIAQGYQVVDQAEKADLVVVNTCCVTLKAAADSRKMLRHYQTHTSARVIGTGCWNSAFPDQANDLLDTENQIPNQDKYRIADFLIKDIVPLSPIQGINLGHRQRTRAFVKVQDGCNNRCSYCLTQIARGSSRSEPIERIIETINRLVHSGIKEVVLTGVQIGSWGKDLGEMRINDLIDAILEKTEIPRLRLSSIEPWDVTVGLINLFNDPRFCPHMHIPIQSGSDTILKAMRRPLAKSALSGIIEVIKIHRPNVAITTDVIVGFPGETQSDLEETLEFIEISGFTGGHVFKFSPMPGTEACSLPGQVQETVRKERLQQVQSLFDRLSATAKKKRIGTVQEVLFEGSRKGIFEGYTPDYLRVKTSSSINLTNSIRKVELVDVIPDGKLEGRLV